MLVKDVMTRDVITVNLDDSVEKCANLLFEHNISGLPVVNEEGKVSGMITEGDLIRRAARIKAPGYLEVLGGLVYLGNPVKFVEELKKAMSLKTGDLMTDKVIDISADNTVEEAATKMLKHGVSRLPVTDWNKKPVGIISRRDIMHSLYNQ